MTTRRRATASAPLMPVDEGPRLVLIDGNALVHRSFRAISIRGNLTVGSTGEDITGVYGFTNTFLRAIQDYHPTHCAITFDLPVPTFRHKMYTQYKAQRPATPPELRSQFDRVRQLMRAFHVPIFEIEGWEADDVLGTLSLQAEQQEVPTIILTGDTDTLQLVSPWVRVAIHSGVQDKRIYDEAGGQDPLSRAGRRAAARLQGSQGRPLGQHPRRARYRRQDGSPAPPRIRELGRSLRER